MSQFLMLTVLVKDKQRLYLLTGMNMFVFDASLCSPCTVKDLFSNKSYLLHLTTCLHSL